MRLISRDQLSEWVEQASREMRFAMRRRYLRKDIGKFHTAKTSLTKEQLREAKRYWKRYSKHYSPLWHRFFTEKTGTFDPRFIPEDLMFTDIEGYLNDWSSAHGVDNKNNYKMYFPEIRHPKAAFRRMRGLYHDDDYSLISQEQAMENCRQMGNVIFKYAVESGKGGGIRFWKTEDGEDALVKLFDKMPQEMLAQEFISQHAELEKINPSSVNSIRIVTLMRQEGVSVLAAYLRMGNPGARVDNVCFGGCCSAIKADGTLMDFGYSKAADKITTHSTGFRFAGFHVPSYDNVVDVVKRMHQKMGDFRIVSWDIAIAPDGEPVFIEMNLKYGAMEYHQLFNGPLFGDDTEAILDEIYRKKA